MAEIMQDEVEQETPVTTEEVKEEVTEAVEEPKVESVIPERYRNKNLEELVHLHQEAEKALSKQGNELGELRKLSDELIKSTLNKKPEVAQPEEMDFFENPKEAIRRAVESNPKVLQAEEYALQARKEANRQRLLQAHPDLSQVVNDDFISWVKESPVRTKLFKEADENFDFDSGNELVSTYKAIKGLNIKQVPKVDPIAQAERKEIVKKASVGTSGTNESRKPILIRSELMKLKMLDPMKYESMQEEIMQAYMEKRVR